MTGFLPSQGAQSSKQWLTTSAPSVLAAPWLSTYASPGTSDTNCPSMATCSGAEAQGFELPASNVAPSVTDKNPVPTNVTTLTPRTTAAALTDPNLAPI